MIVGEALGVFISAGFAAWSAISHDRDKPEIESRLRTALNAGMDSMWRTLMDDPQRGVLYPINRMNAQLEAGLFPAHESIPDVPF